MKEPGLNRVIRSAYKLLGLKTFYTAGPKEVRAWTIKRDATAPQAAGAIHTDFERGFIRAEVIGYDAFIERRGEQRRARSGRAQARGQDLRRAGRRRDPLQVQRLTRSRRGPRGPSNAFGDPQKHPVSKKSPFDQVLTALSGELLAGR